MAVDQDLLDQIAGTIADLYREVESALVRAVAQRLRKDLPLPSPFEEGKLDAVRQLQASARLILASLQATRAKLIREAVANAYRSGGDAGVADLPASWTPKVGQQARDAVKVVPNARVLENLAQALHRDVGRMDQNILRAPVDAYRAVQAGTAARVASGAFTRREASQAAWQRLMDKGITSFTDRANRTWRLSSYVEMMARTNIQRAAVQGQTDRLESIGIDLVYISDNVQECKVCRPFESKVLRRDAGPTGKIKVEHATIDDHMVTVDVIDTLAGAMAKGLFHPNAILGNQQCRVLGELENAARAWYEGPSVHLATARGKRLTVSPNHPVLTTLGWLPADRIREGMHVFSAGLAERDSATTPAGEDLDDAPTSFEQVFDALAAHGRRTSVTASGDDFHGDGRSYKGEVDVVWTERALLDVLHTLGIEQRGEGGLVGSGVELHPLADGRPHLACGHGVTHPVGGSLPDGDVVGLESASQRRLADSEDLGEILASLSCNVTPDQVVHVQRDWYEGHAYDLQTSTGAYLTADIVVHNCRHSASAYLPGITKPAKNTADPEGNKARQRQRALERRIRAAKEQQVGALTPEAKKQAGANVRAHQAALRAHLQANPKLKRLPYREQIGAGNIPKAEGPKGGAVGDLAPPVQERLPHGSPDPHILAKPKPSPPAVPAAAQPYHRNLDGIEGLAAAVQRAHDAERSKLSGGQSAATELVTAADGTKLVAKKGLDWGEPDEVAESVRTQADAEQLASLLGRAIGAPVVAVYRDSMDTVWMPFLEGDVGAGDMSGPGGQLLGLLDHLAVNADRNSGNIITTADGPVGIDHGWSWSSHNLAEAGPVIQDGPDRPASHFSRDGRWVDNPLTMRDVHTLRERLEGLRPDFEHVDRSSWLDYSLRVLDQIAEHARGTVNLIA